jgi:pyroglutamyl-peptidase
VTREPACLLVTGFEPFGPYALNPSGEVAKAVDGRRVGAHVVRAAVLPVHHAHATAAVEALLDDLDPVAVLHLGLAGGRARVALERVALNVMDYDLPDAAGFRATGEPCVPGGPAAHFSTLPLAAILAALTAAGIPAYVSSTAGTYLCNQTLYGTLHAAQRRRRPRAAGFLHLPLLPSMVAAMAAEAPSMDQALMLRAVEITLDVTAATLTG